MKGPPLLSLTHQRLPGPLPPAPSGGPPPTMAFAPCPCWSPRATELLDGLHNWSLPITFQFCPIMTPRFPYPVFLFAGNHSLFPFFAIINCAKLNILRFANTRHSSLRLIPRAGSGDQGGHPSLSRDICVPKQREVPARASDYFIITWATWGIPTTGQQWGKGPRGHLSSPPEGLEQARSSPSGARQPAAPTKTALQINKSSASYFSFSVLSHVLAPPGWGC